MSSIFFDAKGILLIDYLQSGKTIAAYLLQSFGPTGCDERFPETKLHFAHYPSQSFAYWSVGHLWLIWLRV